MGGVVAIRLTVEDFLPRRRKRAAVPFLLARRPGRPRAPISVLLDRAEPMLPGVVLPVLDDERGVEAARAVVPLERVARDRLRPAVRVIRPEHVVPGAHVVPHEVAAGVAGVRPRALR